MRNVVPSSPLLPLPSLSLSLCFSFLRSGYPRADAWECASSLRRCCTQRPQSPCVVTTTWPAQGQKANPVVREQSAQRLCAIVIPISRSPQKLTDTFLF